VCRALYFESEENSQLEKQYMHFIKIESVWILINLFYGQETEINHILAFSMADPTVGDNEMNLSVLTLISKTL
jgi:hypothetical protein